MVPIAALTSNLPSSNSISSKLSRTGRKMDAAWKQAISEGLKASGKIGHNAKNFANSKGLTNTLAVNSLKLGSKVGGAVQSAKTIGKLAPSAISNIIKKPSIKIAKKEGARVGLAVKRATLGGKITGAINTAKRLDKAGFRTSMSGKIKLK
jgi:hypothetical protein